MRVRWSVAAVVLLVAACGGRTADDLGTTGVATGTGGGGPSSAGGSSATGGGAGQGDGGATGGSGLGGHAHPCGGAPPTCSGCPGTPSFPGECTPSGWRCPTVDCGPGCVSPTQCGGGTYCNAGPSTCPTSSQTGTCTPIPNGCTDIYSPHCGCATGKVYPNECEANKAGEPAVPCNGAGGAAGAAGGPGSPCGGLAGTPCPPGSYCDYPDKQCGGNDGLGTCQVAAPCGVVDGPVCGCDGKIHPSTCAAQAAGVDLSLVSGQCPAPFDTFACGTHFCVPHEAYCRVTLSDVAGYANDYECDALPIECQGGTGGCDCLGNVACGLSCVGTPTSGLTVSCGGG